MINDQILLIAVNFGVAALIGGASTYFCATGLLRVLFFLWVLLSMILMVFAVLDMPFDREVFVLLWTNFALPALAGALAGIWLVRLMKGKDPS